MSKTIEDPCENCFFPFPRYATICPACKEARWVLCYKFIHPHPDSTEFPDRYTPRGEMTIPSAGLIVIENEDGTVRLIQADPETGSWEKIEKPFGDTPMMPVGYFWINEQDWEQHIPVEEFPPKEESFSSPRLTDAITDILQTLAESRERLTRKRLHSTMIGKGRERGQSTLAGALPKLRDAGWIDNRQDGDPAGYAITAEGRSILAKAKSRCL